MDGYGRQVFSARTVRLLDGLLVAYVIVWTVAGVLIGIDIRRQAELSDQVTRVGSALTDIGDSLDILSAVPLVGGNIGDLAHRVLDAGRSVTASGRESRASLERMGVVVALAFTLVPLMLVLPVYLPLRLAWRREVRALAALPYERLLDLGGDPWARLESGDVTDLADAELARLGLRRPGR